MNLNALEKSTDINGLGLIFDLVLSCLDLDPNKRPTINDIMNSDLFNFDKYEKVIVKKFTLHALKCYSQEDVVKNQILTPLRDVINFFIR